MQVQSNCSDSDGIGDPDPPPQAVTQLTATIPKHVEIDPQALKDMFLLRLLWILRGFFATLSVGSTGSTIPVQLLHVCSMMESQPRLVLPRISRGHGAEACRASCLRGFLERRLE